MPLLRKTVVAAIVFLLIALLNLPAAHAQSDDAAQILKVMSDYLVSQKTLSADFESDIEVITPALEKIQFDASGKLLLSRPDKLRATRTGGYADVELVSDGKTATILGKNIDAYAQLDSAGSIDQLIDRLQNQYSIVAPGSDLLLSHPYDALMSDVLEAKHIGRGVIDGVECEHLAFRGHDTDWQIWVEVGAHPLPHKYVITSKTVNGAPQYTLQLSNWKTDAPIAADAFAFSPPADAKKVELGDLHDIDEVPAGVTPGEKQ